jgi:acetate---CoA ligase (ADP-forming)
VDLRRLFHPRSVAVVGASEREGSYGGQTLVNLETLGYPGRVWAVNPNRRRVHGRECVPSLGDLPAAPDAVVVAVPAASVPALIEEAGEIGAGGAVVYGAGFAEIADGRELEGALVTAARRYELPVCGPNGNGIVSFPGRVALWGDALSAREPGEVAIVSQSGNQAVNALSARRGLRFHTVVSCGNGAVLEAADFLLYLAGEEGVRSVALNLEDDGDGARLCEALAACAGAGIGVAVLKVGASEAGATAAAAHTGAVAGDQRVFRALLDEAGAVAAADFHDLLELAKALATRNETHDLQANRGVGGTTQANRAVGGTTQADRGGGGTSTDRAVRGLAVLTCSGGDSSAAADEAHRAGIEFPAFREPTERRLRELVPPTATVANPLDYTAMIWGDRARLRELIRTVAEDPGVAQLLIFYDEPADLTGDPKISWDAVREGILDGAADSPVPVVVSSTLPELLQDDSATRMVDAGVPAVAGLRTGVACAVALMRAPGESERLLEVAELVRSARERAGPAHRRPQDVRADSAPDGAWLAEHEAKALLRDAGAAVVEGRITRDEDDAASLAAELGGPVVAKLSDERLRHKSELGALALDLWTEDDVRTAHARLRSLRAGEILVERHAPPGVELLIAARRSGVVPSLAVGLGGVWTEALDDAAIVPLPATPARVERALRALRGASLLTGGRGRTELDVSAAARIGATVGRLLFDAELELLELNPVVVYEDGAVIVDALARTTAPAANATAVTQ